MRDGGHLSCYRFMAMRLNSGRVHYTTHSLVVCHECDAVQRVNRLPPGGVAHCSCCGARLFGNPKGGLNGPFALMLGALVLFLIANLYPLLTLDIKGLTQATTLSGAAMALYEKDMEGLAAVVWFTTVVGPGLFIVSTLYILGSLRYALGLPWTRQVLVWMTRFNPWGMMDVLMLGILVALVKLVGLASVTPGPGLYAFATLIFVFAGAASRLELHLLWENLEARR